MKTQLNLGTGYTILLSVLSLMLKRYQPEEHPEIRAEDLLNTAFSPEDPEVVDLTSLVLLSNLIGVARKEHEEAVSNGFSDEHALHIDLTTLDFVLGGETITREKLDSIKNRAGSVRPLTKLAEKEIAESKSASDSKEEPALSDAEIEKAAEEIMTNLLNRLGLSPTLVSARS